MTLPSIDVWNWVLGKLGSPSLIGPPLASAATIAPTHAIHHVTGTTEIVTITPPAGGFSGIVILIADGIWTWSAAGNIAVLGTVTAALGAVIFVFDPATDKWYPSRVA